MPANPTPDFAKLVRDACQVAQQSARDLNQKFGWDDIERIVRQLDEGHFPPESKPRPKSSNPSPFGDRKAIPPLPDQVTLYSASIGWKLDGEAFCDFYERKGWMVGRTKMKDWQAACRYAKREKFAFGGPSKNGNDDNTSNYSKSPL